MSGLGAVAASAGPKGPEGGQVQIQTTLDDFFLPGTQPSTDPKEFAPIVASNNCGFCHGDYYGPDQVDLVDDPPSNGWVTSLMAQAVRDPVWQAALTITNQDANVSGEYCIRCHAPGAWLAGKSSDGTLDNFTNEFPSNDFDGINCHFCHRAVNPVLEADSPLEDAAIIADLEFPPGGGGSNARYVVDPHDVRRGPYEDIAMNPDMNLHGVPVVFSPWHSRGDLCGTCHEVRNPIFTRDANGDYVLNALGEEHPTQDPNDMYPEQTTYSEWLNSTFATAGVQFDDGRFGGANDGPMQSCQDCHMPDQVAGGCFAWEFPPFFERQDLPQHTFTGSNNWVLKAVRALYDDSETGLSAESVERAIERTNDFLAASSDALVTQVGDQLQVRVVNFTGHKLPTGYPEGRRMWVNVQFLDAKGGLLDERGGYDPVTAELDGATTKVYEKRAGIRPEVASAANLPAGESFHLSLNSEVILDNRIPAIGFTNAAYEAFGGEPKGYTYEDGQYWDDTFFDIPVGTTSAVVNVYYQSMTKEYIEWLRDTNVTDNLGQTVYDLWADPTVGNKAPPVTLDSVQVKIGSPLLGDVNGDGMVDFSDILSVLSAFGTCPPPQLCAGDVNGDGEIDFTDLLTVLSAFGT
ncbi:MAG: dockerin type I domain-containing protein [Phycisphaerales bacterium]